MDKNSGLRRVFKFIDDYGAKVRVQESSTMGEDCIWFFTDGGGIDNNKGSSHMTPEQATRVSDALTEWLTWIDENPLVPAEDEEENESEGR